MTPAMEPRFIPGPLGQLFTLGFFAPQPARGTFIYVPPFAEEANKSRRMAALQARCLVQQQFDVIFLDLSGTGDSQGDFAQATWSLWKDDIRALLNHLGDDRAVHFWGLRSGCLLIADFLSQTNTNVGHCLFWQPVVSGEQMMTQFLRLEMASSMAAGDKITPKTLRQRLQQGQHLEIAGYELNPQLVAELDRVKMAELGFSCQKLHWLELVKQEGKTVSPVAQKILNQWQARMEVFPQTVLGDSFWSTQEIATVPALLQYQLETQ